MKTLTNMMALCGAFAQPVSCPETGLGSDIPGVKNAVHGPETGLGSDISGGQNSAEIGGYHESVNTDNAGAVTQGNLDAGRDDLGLSTNDMEAI